MNPYDPPETKTLGEILLDEGSRLLEKAGGRDKISEYCKTGMAGGASYGLTVLAFLATMNSSEVGGGQVEIGFEVNQATMVSLGVALYYTNKGSCMLYRQYMQREKKESSPRTLVAALTTAGVTHGAFSNFVGAVGLVAYTVVGYSGMLAIETAWGLYRQRSNKRLDVKK